jgi:dTDP-4-dehydrorhamnose 3,5-epimerase
MKIIPTEIPDLLLIEPKVFGDARGFFFESYSEKLFIAGGGPKLSFVQDNHSRSSRGVLRGLHYQIQQPQGKLVRCTSGEVYDVAVDIRKSSPTFGKWVGVILSEENKRMLYVPPGFAHGFVTLSDTAEFLYKTTDYYAPQYERTILWNDSTIGVEWPLKETPLLSKKDAEGIPFPQAEVYP